MTALGLALVLIGGAVAQQPPARKQPQFQPPANAAQGANDPNLRRQDTTLYLMLRTGPKETEPGILDTIAKGLAIINASATKPTIKTISPAIYAELTALVDQATDAQAVEAADGLSVIPLMARETTYSIKVSRAQVLKKLTITYQNGGAKEYRPKAPSKDEPEPQLALIYPGNYGFRPDPNDVPQSYEATVSGGPGQPDGTLKGTWPVVDRFFVVTVRNFAGNKERLFEVIQDGQQVANPFSDVKLGSDFLFAFAGLNSSAGQTGGDIDSENKIKLSAEAIPKRAARRVWALFPLDDAGLKAAKAKYGKMGTSEISAAIRAENPLRSAGAGGPVPALGAEGGPKWYELTATAQGANGLPAGPFAAMVQLTDLPAMAQKFPTISALYVWEFDNANGTAPEAIRVEHPTDGPTVALERERPNWQRALSDAVKRDAAKPKAKE